MLTQDQLNERAAIANPRLFCSPYLHLQNGNPPVRVGRVSQLASCPIITSAASPPTPPYNRYSTDYCMRVFMT